MSVWKPKPAVAWMCQVQTSLCVLNEESSISRKITEKLYGGAISLNGVWEAAMYTTSSRIVLALFSRPSPSFSPPSLSCLNTHFRAIRKCQLEQAHRITLGCINIDLTPILQHTFTTIIHAVPFRVIWFLCSWQNHVSSLECIKSRSPVSYLFISSQIWTNKAIVQLLVAACSDIIFYC